MKLNIRNSSGLVSLIIFVIIICLIWLSNRFSGLPFYSSYNLYLILSAVLFSILPFILRVPFASNKFKEDFMKIKWIYISLGIIGGLLYCFVGLFFAIKAFGGYGTSSYTFLILSSFLFFIPNVIGIFVKLLEHLLNLDLEFYGFIIWLFANFLVGFLLVNLTIYYLRKMKKNIRKLAVIILINILLILTISQIVFAWWGEDPIPLGLLPLKKDHGKLTTQAINIININDTKNIYDELTNLSNLVKESSDNLDQEEFRGYKPKNKQGYIDFNSAHFYHPNGSSLNNQWPSALNEAYDWLEEAISEYSKNNKKAAFTKLGYMLHLLQDVAVPAHSHLIGHSNSPFDYLEFKADADEINTTDQSPVQVYKLLGNDLYAIERQFNELARKSYNESGNQSVINTYYGEGNYIGNNQPCGFLLIGQTCSPNISSSDVTPLQNDLMPKAVQYSAGLAMRVYDIFKSLDWPTYHHDNQRTGFTILKGDIDSTNTKNDVDYVLQSTTEDALTRPAIRDLDIKGFQDGEEDAFLRRTTL